jgi:cell division transport system ATP-binding protein
MADTDQPAGQADGAAAAPFPVVLSMVTLRYGDAVPALERVSLQLPPASFHLLTGPSGAGKSSLLRLIYMILKPSAGRVEVFGRDTQSVRPRERQALRRAVGCVFQELRLLDHLSAFENVALPLRLLGRSPRDYRDDVNELLRFAGLEGRAEARPGELSGGERQRLALARAILARPRLMIADEPSAGLDAEQSRRLARLLLEINKRGVTVIAATHDPEFMAASGAPEIRLERGRVVSLPDAATPSGPVVEVVSA